LDSTGHAVSGELAPLKRGDYGEISIFVLVDALGWEFAQEHQFLSDILPFRNGMETVLGFSSAAIPTVLSGLMPENHGHWCLFRRRRFFSCFSWTWPFFVLPARLRENHRTRSAIGTLTRSLFNITGYFCLYEVPVSILHRLDYVERKDLWAPEALGKCRTIFDDLTTAAIPYHSSGWKDSDEQKLADCARAVVSSPVRCCVLYLSELDAALHLNGLESQGAREALVAAGVRIRRLLARAKEFYSRVSLFVFSDHGMTSVTETHDLKSVLASKLLRKSGYFPFFDSTMARFWVKGKGTRAELEDALASLPYGRVLSEDEKMGLGLRFKRNEYGEVIFVMNPGHVIVPSFASGARPMAMHGFHPSDPFSRASFLSSTEVGVPPGHVKDVYRFMKDELGL
jgi:hypothetical protein